MEKAILENLIEKGYSLRDLAKTLNCSVATIRYWLKVHGLTTIFQQYRKPIEKPKREIPIANNVNNALWIDITDLSIKAQKGKHLRSVGIKCLHGVYGNKKYAIMFKESLDKARLIEYVKILLNLTKAQKVIADKEFHVLNEIIQTYRIAKWNCSKQLNEKHFGGLKTKAYPIFRYIKKTLGLNDNQLLANETLVYSIYKAILERHGYTIIEKFSFPEQTISIIH